MTSASTLRKYGLTVEQYDLIRASQDGRCGICSKPFSLRRHPCVDHDHATGLARGLLCPPCNQLIGYLHENTRWLRRALSWLTGGNTAALLRITARHVDAPPIKETA